MDQDFGQFFGAIGRGTQLGLSLLCDRPQRRLKPNYVFDIKDLVSLGVNTFRIYGGMSRWEAEDDDGKYGWPSITKIKTNPNILNWDWWDNIMTNPPKGSDYGWSGKPGTVWQGNARTIFAALKQANILSVVSIRNVDNNLESILVAATQSTQNRSRLE